MDVASQCVALCRIFLDNDQFGTFVKRFMPRLRKIYRKCRAEWQVTGHLLQGDLRTTGKYLTVKLYFTVYMGAPFNKLQPVREWSPIHKWWQIFQLHICLPRNLELCTANWFWGRFHFPPPIFIPFVFIICGCV